MGRILIPRRDLILPNRLKQRGFFLLNPFAHGGGATDPNFSYVVSLNHFEDASATDVIAGRTWTLSGASVTTTQPKFGTQAFGTSTTQGRASSTHASFNPGTQPFTFEWWTYPTALGAARIMFDMRPNGVEGAYITVYFNGTALTFYRNSTNTIVSGSVSTINSYRHYAIARDSSNNTRLFDHGTQVGSTLAGDTTNYLGTTFNLGNYAGGSNGINGYTDEFRATIGLCRYTGNFTPPTEAFPSS